MAIKIMFFGENWMIVEMYMVFCPRKTSRIQTDIYFKPGCSGEGFRRPKEKLN